MYLKVSGGGGRCVILGLVSVVVVVIYFRVSGSGGRCVI